MAERSKRRRTNNKKPTTAASASTQVVSVRPMASPTRVASEPIEPADLATCIATTSTYAGSEQVLAAGTTVTCDTRGGTDRSNLSGQQPVMSNDEVISWIHDNYEWNTESDITRSGVYDHYRQYYSSRLMKPVSAPAFGKIIRNAFPNVTTRRLGNRGQSKYRYCGIKRKESSLETHTVETAITTPNSRVEQLDSSPDRRSLPHPNGPSSFRLPLPLTSKSNLLSGIYTPPLAPRPIFSTSNQSLIPIVLDETGDPPSLFAHRYNHHCRVLHTVICAGEFEKLESIFKDFYQNLTDSDRSLLVTFPKLVESICHWDCVLYDSLIVDLFPKMDTRIPKQMIPGIRHLVKVLPTYLNHLLQDYPTKLRRIKVNVAELFVCKLNRHLTLNQFAIAASDILEQPGLLSAMKMDWDDLDINTILDHVLWISDCRRDDILQILRKDIAQLLTTGSNLDQWIAWEENLINKYVPQISQISQMQDAGGYLTMAKQFILKYKMFTGLLMQQFYINQVSSIDCLRSLQFFLDDLVLYHVEERISSMNVNINNLSVLALDSN